MTLEDREIMVRALLTEVVTLAAAVTQASEETDPGLTDRARRVSGAGDELSRASRLLMWHTSALETERDALRAKDPDERDFWDAMPGLSARVTNALERHGITSIREVRAVLSGEDQRHLSGLGQTSLAEIERELSLLQQPN